MDNEVCLDTENKCWESQQKVILRTLDSELNFGFRFGATWVLFEMESSLFLDFYFPVLTIDILYTKGI